jgi:hypothetical protein
MSTTQTLAQKTETEQQEREENRFSRGDRVLVRDSVGQWLERRVWDATDNVVYVCTDRLFDALRAGRCLTPPVGFPKGDVTAAA